MCGAGFAFTNTGGHSFEEVQSYEQFTHSFFEVGLAPLVGPAAGLTGCFDCPVLHLGTGLDYNADHSYLLCFPGLILDGQVVWANLDYVSHGPNGLR